MGSITDLEDMSLSQKLQLLKSNATWKCSNKWEVLNEHDATWNTNGLHDLKYSVLSRDRIDDNYHKVLVNVMDNNHWTDAVSGKYMFIYI